MYKQAFRSDCFILKKYGRGNYKLVCMKRKLDKGSERDLTLPEQVEKYIFPEDKKKNVSCETRMSDERMSESISRTKKMIFEYAMCNKWQYFVTLTLDAEKIDRYDCKNFMVKFNRMISDLNKKITGEDWGRKERIIYLLVPEVHKNGGFHFHGFIGGLHCSDVRTNEHGYKEWLHYRDNFGFMNMERIRNVEATAKYATKYITKDLKKATVSQKGMHLYYASHGLEKAQTIYTGYGYYKGEYDYVNDYCAVVNLDMNTLANFVPTMKRSDELEEDVISHQYRVYGTGDLQ